MTRLIRAALKNAKRAQAAAIEVYPTDETCRRAAPTFLVGTASTFARAVFREVARQAPARPIMRHDLKVVAAWKMVEARP